MATVKFELGIAFDFYEIKLLDADKNPVRELAKKKSQTFTVEPGKWWVRWRVQGPQAKPYTIVLSGAKVVDSPREFSSSTTAVGGRDFGRVRFEVT